MGIQIRGFSQSKNDQFYSLSHTLFIFGDTEYIHSKLKVVITVLSIERPKKHTESY